MTTLFIDAMHVGLMSLGFVVLAYGIGLIGND